MGLGLPNAVRCQSQALALSARALWCSQVSRAHTACAKHQRVCCVSGELGCLAVFVVQPGNCHSTSSVSNFDIN